MEQMKNTHKHTYICFIDPIRLLHPYRLDILQDEIRIRKLEKEKTIMRDLCRSRSKLVKEQEKRIAELEKLLHSSS